MLTVLLLIIGISQIAISLGLSLSRSRSPGPAQKLFVLVSSATFFWTVANTVLLYVDQYGNNSNLGQFNFANKAGFTLGALSLLLIYIFTLTFPKVIKFQNTEKALSFIGIFLVILSPLHQISGKFTLINQKPVYSPGIFSTVFAIFSLLVITAVFINAARSLHTTKEHIQRKQIITLLTGLSLTVIHAVAFIIVVPAFTGDNATIFAIGYLAPYYFTTTTIYSLIKQSLFDIRLIVARAVAYILSLGTLVTVYTITIFAVAELIFKGDASITIQRAFYSVLAVISSLFYGRIKAFFDKITNRIFYQDAYEPQKFLDELNEVLVANIELEKLLEDSIYVIQQNLKTSYCVFTIRETSYFPRRFVGDPGGKFKVEDIEEINKAHAHVKDKVIVADLLEDEDRELKRILDRNDTAVLVRLVPTLDYEIQGLGHILFGAKKSGNPYNKQDIQVLEIIANELVIAVQNGLRFEEIEKFNVTLQEKIDDATHKLKKTNEKLQALDETKDEFISMASHQLRTPLTSVKGYLSMVLEGDAGEVNEMQKKLLDQAFVSSQRMVYLIADLLNVSRLRTGKFVIEAIPTNLAEVIEGETGQLKETAKARGLTLTYEKPANFPTLLLDETKIRQVIMNFMDNAIYYAKPNGHVDVSVKDTGKTVEFTVTDDGIGVPKSEQHHLFTKFYRAGNAKKARPDGTGLGLFMAKKVIVAQGGSLIFKSEEGKGSTFGFSFAKDKLVPTQIPTDTKA